MERHQISDQQAANSCESHHARYFFGEIARDLTPWSRSGKALFSGAEILNTFVTIEAALLTDHDRVSLENETRRMTALLVVPGRGLEPLRISPPDPKSGASANFATLASLIDRARTCAVYAGA